MQTTIDPAEIAKFEAMAAEWWDPAGKFKPLHMINPTRLDYINGEIAGRYERDLSKPLPFKGLRILDIGCGGGLLSEPMARLGAEIVGADAAEGNLPVARIHAEQMGLEIDYRHTSAEALAEAGEQFDVVLNMEVIEHVGDLDGFLAAAAALVAPGGLFFGATLNRTPKAFALAIVGAEYLLRWVPRGTHDWRRFVKPSELARGLRKGGLGLEDVTGVSLDLASGDWRPSGDAGVNYMLCAAKG